MLPLADVPTYCLAQPVVRHNTCVMVDERCCVLAAVALHDGLLVQSAILRDMHKAHADADGFETFRDSFMAVGNTMCQTSLVATSR